MKLGSKATEKDLSMMRFCPTKPHFFKPLLHGCFSQLNIPSAFFFKYLSTQKKYEQAVLRTKQGEWTVKIDGPKFEDGWTNFIRDNNLDIGDLLVFKLEENMVFDVVVFDSSASEKEFSQSNVKESEPKILEHGMPPKKSVKEKSTNTNSKGKSAISRSGYPFFVSTIKADCLNRSRFYIPLEFARENGLDRNGDIVLRDDRQRSWTVGLKKNGKRVCIIRGWSGFRKANGLNLGGSFMFELICGGKKPVANFVLTN